MEKIVLDKIYRKRENFTLDVKNFLIFKNKINIVLGENGAGKSTLLNSLIEDDCILKEYKKTLLTQTSYTFNRSCIKNIEMVLKWNDQKKDPIEFLEIVDLVEKKDVLGNKLSGGEKKRLAFAMALATSADIILLDEPFANVDSKNQRKLIGIVESLKGKKTVILVSHRMSICKELGDYFMEIEEGKLVKSGTLEEFFK